ncbi:hypothetical protein ACPPVT_05245 [Angustibacter sp. McL0619]|uniref:hypothetical protein n=1 Tax=Angustibacter sp. McL0619 TaxID=3415676 RepID=UPI003CEEEE34
MDASIAAELLVALLVGALVGGLGFRALSAARRVVAAAERDLARLRASDLATGHPPARQKVRL